MVRFRGLSYFSTNLANFKLNRILVTNLHLHELNDVVCSEIKVLIFNNSF